jgi:hypothetical protein
MACEAPKVNSMKIHPPRSTADESAHFSGRPDPALDPASLAVARASGDVPVPGADLIERPGGLIGTPR